MSDDTKKTMEAIDTIVGLSKDENKVYTIILKDGFATIPGLARYAKMKEAKIQEILGVLEQRQLVKKVKGTVARYIPIRPFGLFTKSLESYNNEIKQAQLELQKLQSEGEKSFNTFIEEAKGKITASINQTKDQFSEGRTGAHKMFIDGNAKLTAAQDGLTASVPELIHKKLQGVQENFSMKSSSLASQFTIKSEGSLTTIEKDLNTIVQQIQTELANIQKNGKSQSDGLNQKLIASVGQNQENLKIIVTKLIDDLKVDIGKFTEDLKKNKSLTKDQVASSLTGIHTLITQLSTDLKGKWETYTSQITTQINAIKQKTLEAIEKYRASAEEKLNKNILTQKTAIEQSRDKISADLSKFSTDYANTTMNVTQMVDANITQLVNVNSEKTTQLEGSLNTQTKSIVDNGIASTDEFAAAILEEMNQVFAQKLDLFKNGASNFKEIVTTSVQNEVQRYKTEVKDALEKIQAQYLTNIENAGETYQTAFNEQINTLVVNLQDELKKLQKEFENKIKDSTNKQTQALQQLNGQMTDTTQKSKSAWITQVNSELTKTKSTITDQITAKANQCAQIIKTDTDQVMQGMNSVVSSITQNNTLLTKDITDLSKAESSQITDQLFTATTGFTNEMKKRADQFGTEMESGFMKLDQAGKEIPEKSITVPVKDLSLVEPNLVKNKDGNLKLMDDLKKSTGDIITTLQTQLEGVIKQIPPNITGKFTSSVTKMKDELKALTASITELRTGMETTYNAGVKDAETQSVQVIQEVAGKIKTNLTAAQTAVAGTFKQLDDLSAKNAETLDSQLKLQLADTKKAIDTKIKDTITVALAPLQKAFVASGTPAKILKDKLEILMETASLDIEKTWIIVGQEQVMDYINEIIGRAKANCEIVIPRFDDLDWKFILERLKVGVKFQVATDYASAKNQKQISTIFQAGVDLWSYNDHDIIVIVRDSEEEILLSPVSNQDDTSAVVSEIGPFVSKLKTMVASYWRSAGKKYKETNPT